MEVKLIDEGDTYLDDGTHISFAGVTIEIDCRTQEGTYTGSVLLYIPLEEGGRCLIKSGDYWRTEIVDGEEKLESEIDDDTVAKIIMLNDGMADYSSAYDTALDLLDEALNMLAMWRGNNILDTAQGNMV